MHGIHVAKRLTVDLRELGVTEHHPTRSRRGNGEDACAITSAIDPLEKRRIVPLPRGARVYGLCFTPLRDLALDELTVRFKGKRRYNGVVRDRKPVKAFDCDPAWVGERLVDLRLRDAVLQHHADGLRRNLERARFGASGSREIDSVDLTASGSISTGRAVVGHASCPVLPEGDSFWFRSGGSLLECKPFPGMEFLPAGRSLNDGCPARDIGRDIVSRALEIETGADCGEGDIARGVEKTTPFRRCRFDPDLARHEVNPALADDDSALGTHDNRRAIRKANQCASTAIDFDGSVEWDWSARCGSGALVPALQADGTGGKLQSSSQGG